MRIAGLSLAFALLAASAAPVLACTPAPGWNDDKQRTYDDELLRNATVFYRGVVEDLGFDSGGNPRLTIRRTRTLWGDGAPDRLATGEYYFASCPRGNLAEAVIAEGKIPNPPGVPGYQTWPVVQNGWGVTVIGRPGDAASDWLILVDGVPGTQELVTRFRRLKFGL